MAHIGFFFKGLGLRVEGLVSKLLGGGYLGNCTGEQYRGY